MSEKTTRVTLLNTYAGPAGTFAAGETVALPADEAETLIHGRYARPVLELEEKKPRKPRKPRKAPAETADDAGAKTAETAKGLGARLKGALGAK